MDWMTDRGWALVLSLAHTGLELDDMLDEVLAEHPENLTEEPV